MRSRKFSRKFAKKRKNKMKIWTERTNEQFKKVILFLSIMGPGIITANVDNDAGGITTYSLAGANFGNSLLWSLIPITIALILIQEMCSRLGTVTGKGLSDLIREKFGVKFTFYLLVLVLVTNFGNVLAEFAGICASLELFGLSRSIFLPILSFLIWYMVVKGTSRSVEKIFLVACLFYISYLVTGFMVDPDWEIVTNDFIQPDIKLSSSYIVMLIAVVGTTIAPWMQFYQTSAVAEKGISIQEYKYSRLDTILGSIVVNIVAFFIIVVCSVVLFQGVGNTPIESAADAAKALEPLAGKYCSLLFGFGLLNASLFAASILPLSTSFCVCEGFGWESGVDKKFSEAPQFYILYSLLIVIGTFIVMFPNIPLIEIMWISQFINGLVLPFVLFSMLIIINDKQIMGDYSNSMFSNILTVLTIVLISFLSLFLAFSSFFDF